MMSQISPITQLRSEEDVSHLIVSAPSTAKAILQPIGEIEVKPYEQPHMSLGNFTATDSPKGFAIDFSPRADPETIATQITSLGSKEAYELVLHIANYGNKTVSAEVRQL